MKLCAHARGDQSAYALVLVLVFMAISMMLLAGTMSWTSTTASLTHRNIEYEDAVSAAEAATEKVLSHMARDYQSQGESLVANNLGVYQGLVPTAAEDPLWSRFQFSDAQGNSGRTYVQQMNSWAYAPLDSQYNGLYGLASTYRIISNARPLGQVGSSPAAGLEQEVQLASIPVFQFAIFYSIDMEINPGANMDVTGRVHSNANIFAQPDGATLTFESHVTAVQQLIPHKKPGDPGNRRPGKVVYKGAHDGDVSSMTLPIGTNNSPAAVHAIVEIPPVGESPGSPIGQQRYYNKADLIILVSNTTIRATSGAFNDFNTTVPPSDIATFVDTSASFYNKREGASIRVIDINVGNLAQWSQHNSSLRPLLGRDVRSLYVADERTPTASTQPGVRLVNGQTLPPLGLTVASPDPVYVEGNYNVPTADLGTASTLGTLPASIVSDAITILSGNWNDANSGKSIGFRRATDTTVNAAFISGIVPTASNHYSGGVENYPRFLENWSGRTFTYNGSMVVMFYSQIATAPWGGIDVYNPPHRNWAFDKNFLDASKLPPCTPELRALIRGQWAAIAPNTIPVN